MAYIAIRKNKYYELITICALLLFSSITKANEHNHAQMFSDPQSVSPVEDGWSEKPIEYDAPLKDADLVVSLGQQTHPVLGKLMAEYAAQKGLKIYLLHGTCGINSGRLLKKKIDIGALCCPPGTNDRYPGMTFHSLGISPIALIVHPSNPIENVSIQTAKDMFQGKITHWSKVESKNSDAKGLIKPVGRLHCKIRPGHWRRLLKDANQFSPSLFGVGVIADVISQVARNARAIGWEVPTMISVYKDKGNVKMLNINGHSPTDLNNLVSGRYPLYRSYSLTTWDNASPKKKKLVSDLVKFLQQQVEKIHSEIAFVTPKQLRDAGWKFKGEELIGEPDKN